MSDALASSVGIVAYLALFMSVGLLFIFANLFIGRFLRANDPHPEKLEIYECGEPSIGSSYVQFDLRFYVVALLFIIFDVEVAFFFPWAAVFGKSTHLMDRNLDVVTVADGNLVLEPHARDLYRELGVRNPTAPDPKHVPASLLPQIDAQASDLEKSRAITHLGARQLAWVTIVDIAVFFAVLMIGFAYVWKRGDLDWVRAITRDRAQREGGPMEEPAESEAVLSA
jgi:NADH-quinone oxidoreductase subunit A